MSGTVIAAVTALVEPILADLGLELYDLEFAGGTLRVTIDTPPGGPAGVDIDTIALVNRTVGRALDHDDVVPGRYVLEVTSPGLERNLRTPAHFRRETGKTVNVRMASVLDGRRRLTGLLEGAADDAFTVRLDDGSVVEVPYSLVDKARTVFVWESQPKPGSREAIAARRAAKADADDDSFDDSTDHHEGVTTP
ncbi:MAG: ribosome maturation factor RimP [Ilumatobacteraceae bacterium]